MRATVGFSDNLNTAEALAEALNEALGQGGGSCDFILLFATAEHDGTLLRESIVSLVGPAVPVIGGGAIGAISNERYGYAGNQVILAAFWLEGIEYNFLSEHGLNKGEEAVGRRLGKKLAPLGLTSASPLLLFYDAINRTDSGVRMNMATPLLAGLEQSLGFVPNLIGAGLMGDYACSPTLQWIGTDTAQQSATILTFKGDLNIESVILHGCSPATGYYTVTKADGAVVLEINGQPAITFMRNLLGEEIRPREYAFFLTFGVNRGDKWTPYDESCYSNRLCLGIDPKRNGIVMFEPDMVAGTQFQIMCRSLDLDYMSPKIEQLFSRAKGRKPVFALYFNCAGRAAAYAGIELEDATAVQKIVAGRAPLLGIYTGVEIGPLAGRPSPLDWTGIFTLFSTPK